MKRTLLMMGALAAVALAGPAAAARDASEVGRGGSGEDAARTTRVDRAEERREQLGEVGVSLSGGLAGYTGGLGDLTGPGVSWGVRAESRPSELAGVEMSYQGSRIPIDDPRVASGTGIFQNGVDVMGKVYAPLNLPVDPFVGAGVGLSYANPGEDAEAFYQNDFIAEVPLAAGVETNIGGLKAGARATFTPLFGESFANPAATGNPNGSRLEGQLTLGGAF